jgi:hypothetical protein
MRSSWWVHMGFMLRGEDGWMDTASSLVSAGRGWFQRRALFFKVIGVGIFGLLLLIPLGGGGELDHGDVGAVATDFGAGAGGAVHVEGGV